MVLTVGASVTPSAEGLSSEPVGVAVPFSFEKAAPSVAAPVVPSVEGLLVVVALLSLTGLALLGVGASVLFWVEELVAEAVRSLLVRDEAESSVEMTSSFEFSYATRSKKEMVSLKLEICLRKT